ncbi:unnamed protein product, partial [Bubo scandiacus]
FVCIFILLRDEALASEPEPGDFASFIHQQQQIHDRVKAAQESHLQAEYGRSLDDHFRPKKGLFIPELAEMNHLKYLVLDLFIPEDK